MARLRCWVSLIYRLVISIFVGILFWQQFHSLGLGAWRLLETWILLAALVYFIFAIPTTWLRRKQPQPLTAFCPVLQGAVIVLGAGMIVLWLFYQAQQIAWPGADNPWAGLAVFLAPILTLVDWFLFTKKGGWQLSYPFYWLGVVISYGCIIILTANFVPHRAGWEYPYGMLNYPEIGIIAMLWWLVLISVILLVIGYAMVSLDYLISGRLGQHIVMPRIKTIVIEEPIAEEIIEPEAVTPEEVAQIKSPKTARSAKSASSASKPSAPKPAKPTSSKKQPSADAMRPVEGIKDQKSAQKLHRASKSKSEIIADIRLQVTGNKSQKSRQRTSVKPSSKTTKKP